MSESENNMAELARIVADEQQADGSFLSYSTPIDDKLGPGARVYTPTFATSLIVGALSAVTDRRLAGVRARAVDWLLGQHGPQWAFNYWGRTEPEAQVRSYPDDWDDTSCAIIALTLARPEVVTGEVLGHIVTLLTQTEMREGGPYRTWIVPEDAPKHWQDVDVAVNANIAYMLRLHGVELPNLEQLIDSAVGEGQLHSPYYPSARPIEYFVSRWYRGAQRERLLARVLARLEGAPEDGRRLAGVGPNGGKSSGAGRTAAGGGRQDGAEPGAGRPANPLELALTVSAALNLGAEPAAVAEAARRLRGLGAESVRPQAFCIDPAIDGRPYVAGSRALTAALCLEALAKCAAAERQAGPAGRGVAAGRGRNGEVAGLDQRGGARAGRGGAGQRIHREVVAQAMARLEQPGKVMEAPARQLRDRLLGGTAAGQITLLPYLFRQALGRRGRDISDARLVDLGLISFYGWAAYTVYDDFLDDEGRPPLLPVANVALRGLVLALQRETLPVPGFASVAWPILDRQEAANAWEVTHCRVQRQSDLLRVPSPDFGELSALAERSMGHALGCLIITAALGHSPESADFKAVQKFFWHFLIARQLGDDAHDWKADLQKGQINAVGAMLLRGVRRGSTVQGLYTKLEQYFWEHAIGLINERIFGELARARAALRDAPAVEKPEVLEVLLSPIEEAAYQAEQQRRQTADFLRTYRPEGESA